MGVGLAAQRRTTFRPAVLRFSRLLLTTVLVLGLGSAALAQRRVPQIPHAAGQGAPVSSPAAVSPAAEQTATPIPPQAALPATSSAPAQLTPARLNTGLVVIESDLQRADQTTGVVTATGNVRIVYPDQRVVATARQAQYFSKEGRVVLSGDVDIVQESGNLLRAEQVVYRVDSERLIAIPAQGQQVFSRLRMQQTAPAPIMGPAAQPLPMIQAPSVAPAQQP